MRIKQKLRQYRRDFDALYECERCGHLYQDYGYDDAHFHRDVIPAMVCGACGKTGAGPSSSPDVPEWMSL